MNKEMLNAAKIARDRAYAPYSKFHVGCCIKSEKGNLYSGCNVENASYPLAVCAERNAIAAMVSAGETKISELLVISSGDQICVPCGGCRQCINEFAMPNTPVHMYSVAEKNKTMTMAELLPCSFKLEQ